MAFAKESHIYEDLFVCLCLFIASVSIDGWIVSE